MKAWGSFFDIFQHLHANWVGFYNESWFSLEQRLESGKLGYSYSRLSIFIDYIILQKTKCWIT